MQNTKGQTKFGELGYDKRLISKAEKIIGQGSCGVVKVVRAGFTTSAILACERQNWKLLVLEPTKRILEETVKKATSGNVVRVPGNHECPRLQEMMERYPVLKSLPMNLPDCDSCIEAGSCEVLEILRVDNFDTAGLTYAKLEALMSSKGTRAKEILAKLSKAEVIIMDEAHTLCTPPAASVRALETPVIPKRYKFLNKICQNWQALCDKYEDNIKKISQKAEQTYAGQYLAEKHPNKDNLSFNDVDKAWKHLRLLAISNEVDESTVVMMKDIIEILSNEWITISYISEKGGTTGKVMISAESNSKTRGISEFLHKNARQARHIYVSGTLYEPRPDYFSGFSGKPISQVIFPDVRKTTEKMVLIPDRWKLGSQNFRRKMQVIIGTIKAISEREKQPIYILTSSKEKSGIIKRELAKIGIEEEVFVDYYRSGFSVGVERKERICIAVGMAEIPANACDVMVRPTGKTLEKSRALRLQSVHAATWQAINRVRDPAGKIESRVYLIGVELEQVKQLATWGTARSAECIGISDKKMPGGIIVKKLDFKITIDEPLEMPRIVGDGKNRKHSERRKVSDYIKSVEKCKNHSNLSNNQYRENGVVFEFYNNVDEKTTDCNARSLEAVFVNRKDCYAQQYLDEKTDRWGYRKVASPLNSDIIKLHLAGEITIATYQLALDDTVTWGCIDIDNHNQERTTDDVQSDVWAVCKILEKYDIPFLLEASGGPDSYHIWVFVKKTKTYNAYMFMRQIVSESGIDCKEIWPKQKKLGDHGKYGNPVKMPLCMHRRWDKRSQFINPQTFQPIEGAIPLPEFVNLLEIPDQSPNKAGFEGMPRVRSDRPHSDNNTLDYCMIHALEDKIPLKESPGHAFRVAIAVKARVIGMSEEEAARLFAKQDDFDYDISLYNVKKTYKYGYRSPYSCDKLRSECGDIVKKYCVTCPFRKRQYASSEANSYADDENAVSA